MGRRTFEMGDPSHLDHVMKAVRKIDGVFDVYRTRFGSLMTAAADRRSARRVSNEVQNRWRAFSRDGMPGDGWPTYSREERAVLVFDRHTRLEHDPNPERRQAWEGFSLTGN